MLQRSRNRKRAMGSKVHQEVHEGLCEGTVGGASGYQQEKEGVDAEG